MFLLHVHNPGCFYKLFSGANEAAASGLYTAEIKIMCQENVLHPWNKIVVHTVIVRLLELSMTSCVGLPRN